jgi:hypothetical protein
VVNPNAKQSPAADTVVVLVLALFAALSCFKATALIPPVALEWQTENVFFSADVPRVFNNMTDRTSHHFRSPVHPLFALLTYPPVELLRRVLGIDVILAARLLIAAAAACWTVLLFTLLRRVGCRRGDAALFTLLGGTSAAATFWFAVPESYPFGSLTILVALLFVTADERRRLSTVWLIVLNVVSMSVTVTNWMAGLIVTLVLRPWRHACRVAVAAFAVVIALTAVQMTMFSRIRPPFYSLPQEIALYTRPEPFATIAPFLAAFAVHPMVMPGIRLIDNEKQREWPKMRTREGIGSWAGVWGSWAAALWVILLVRGIWSLVRMTEHRQLRPVLAGVLVGQLGLHLLYGDETFLYSLHWTPLLIVVAAMSTLTRGRRLALALCGGLIVAAAINNVSQLHAAASYFAMPEPHRLARLEAAAGVEEVLPSRLSAESNGS